jgi:cytidine deaminase
MRLRKDDEALIAEHRELVRTAEGARSHAHAPYSEYAVGSALLLSDGRVIPGSNVENASYGLTVCAERIAIVRWITAIAVAAGPRGAAASGGRPCGACLQVIREFAADPVVLISDGDEVDRVRLSDLLPDPFVPPFGPGAPAATDPHRGRS